MNINEIDNDLEFPQKTGKIFWEKLLLNQNCKNEDELLRKGTVLEGNPHFENAIKFAADEDERAKYNAVKRNREVLVELLAKELAPKELEDKLAINAEELLSKYRQELTAAEKTTQESIGKLEMIEKAMPEQVIDCAAVAEEYIRFLGDMLNTAEQTGDKSKNDITLEEMQAWKSQLDMILATSNAELKRLTEMKSTHPKFEEFKNLINKQKSAVSEVEKNVSVVNSIYSQVRNTVNSVEKITEMYANARKGISDGSYSGAQSCLSPNRFDEIVKQLTKEVKIEGGE